MKSPEQPRPTPPLMLVQRPLHHICFSPPYDRLFQEIPGHIARAPSMMSEGEQKFVFNITREFWTDRGLIIDAGLMLGASTVLFGEAVRQVAANPRHGIVS